MRSARTSCATYSRRSPQPQRALSPSHTRNCAAPYRHAHQNTVTDSRDHHHIEPIQYASYRWERPVDGDWIFEKEIDKRRHGLNGCTPHRIPSPHGPQSSTISLSSEHDGPVMVALPFQNQYLTHSHIRIAFLTAYRARRSPSVGFPGELLPYLTHLLNLGVSP